MEPSAQVKQHMRGCWPRHQPTKKPYGNLLARTLLPLTHEACSAFRKMARSLRNRIIHHDPTWKRHHASQSIQMSGLVPCVPRPIRW